MRTAFTAMPALLAATLLLATAASAQQANPPREFYDEKAVVLDVEDVTITRQEDARALLRRLEQAVESACARGRSDFGVQQYRERVRCEKVARAAALEKLNDGLGMNLEVAAGIVESQDRDLASGRP